MNSARNHWRPIAMALLGAVMAGAGAFLALGADTPDRAEVRRIVETESPWLADKPDIVAEQRVIRERVEHIGEQVDRIDRKLDAVLEEVRR